MNEIERKRDRKRETTEKGQEMMRWGEEQVIV